jgi:hypothetical protein
MQSYKEIFCAIQEAQVSGFQISRELLIFEIGNDNACLVIILNKYKINLG